MLFPLPLLTFWLGNKISDAGAMSLMTAVAAKDSRVTMMGLHGM
jgi:hypothetical protein